MRIKDILRKDFDVSGDVEKEIAGIACDSRNVKSGDIFIAIGGENFDGHYFIEDVVRRGAAAVVYEKDSNKLQVTSDKLKTINSKNSLLVTRYSLLEKYPEIIWIGVNDTRDALAFISDSFFRRPSEEITVIGITGTNGKTTTSYLLRSILQKWGRDTGLIGTINYQIRDTVFNAPFTTPEAPLFQSLLREMADAGCSHVITEVSSHSLAQKRVDYTRFKTAVFTNLTREHLDFHRTMEDYFLAKERLFTELLAEDGAAVINADDPYGERIVTDLKGQGSRVRGQKVRILTYGIKNQNADIVASDIKTTFKGTSFKLRIAECGLRIDNSELRTLSPQSLSGDPNSELFESPLVGITNVYNILSAVSAALSLGMPLDVIREGIGAVSSVRGRFERIDRGQDFLAIVDYAHTEDALERLLLTAHQLRDACGFKKKGRIITLLGCGGNRDKGKRPVMGEIAARLSDFLIITSDNPRNEDPVDIIRDIEKGVRGDNYVIIPDRFLAITTAVETASGGDILLIAGKGHEDYQEIKGVRYDFSDRAVLEDAIDKIISRRRSRTSGRTSGQTSARHNGSPTPIGLKTAC